MPLPRNIVLIGLRGAGKTSVGRALAASLAWDFVDTDELVVRHFGTSIREIFEQHGEAAFRAREARVIADICGGASRIISVGGGAVLTPANRERLRRAGLVVWLTAELDALARRIADDPSTGATRPALTPYAGREELAHLLAARGPLYAEIAALKVDTTRQSVAEVVEALVMRLDDGPDRGSAA